MGDVMGKPNEAYLNTRIPRELMDRIKAQMKRERRANRSEMVRVLIEDGLAAREQREGE
jgi:Arc/MetJ-type ribon-helix-helix transcriptional regulator